MHVDHVTFVVVVNSYVACRSYFFFFLMIQRTPISTLFPYTTLFRSIVEMDEGEAGAMNKPVHLRELKIREANRRIRQASGARAHRPPARKLREVLVDLLLERLRRISPDQRIDMPAVLEE